MVVIIALVQLVFSYNIYSVGVDIEYQEALSSYISSSSSLKYIPLNSPEDLSSSDPSSITVLISLTKKASEVHFLQLFSESKKIPLLLLSSGNSENFSFFSDLKTECFSYSINSLINYFSFIKPSIIWPYSEENLEILENFQISSDFKLTKISLTDQLTSTQVSIILSKLLKKEAVKGFFFLPDEKFCKTVSKGLEEAFLVQKGNLAVFFTSCVFQVEIDGSLFLTYEGFEQVKNRFEYKKLQIQRFLQVFEKQGLTEHEILKKLKNVYNNQCRFSIVNDDRGMKIKVGEVNDGSIFFHKNLRFLGGIYDIRNYSNPVIVISANTGSFNPNGVAPVYSNVDYHQGTYFAVEKINRDRTYFDKYKFQLYDQVNCGVSIFDYNYSRECFTEHRPNMGVAYVPTLFSMNIPLLKQLDSLNLSIPFISGIGSAGLLSSKLEYPYFIRTVSPSSKFSIAWANLIRLYNWNKIIVHYTNDSFGTSAYKILNDSQSEFGFKFINEDKYRSVGYVYDHQSLSPYYINMRKSLSLGCNIVFLIMGDPAAFFWLEGFYDVGARRGDLTFIFFSATGLNNFKAQNADLRKRKELMHGSLAIFNAAWVGQYGEEMKVEYLKYWDDTWGRSYYIDAVYSAAETVDFLLNQGKPFEDKEVFMQAVRSIRFLGATGTVSFDPESNDRNLDTYNVFNFFEDEDGKWHDDAVAMISPLGTVYYVVLKETVWADGELPKSMKENFLNCPFREEEIRKSKDSVNIKIIVSAILFFITSVLMFYALKRMKIKKITMMRFKNYIVFQDYLTFGFIFIEAIQLVSIGPSFDAFNKTLSYISGFLSMDISKITSFRDTTFWIIFYSMTVFSYLWECMLLIIYFDFFRVFKGFYVKVRSLQYLMIPLMSNYLFLPTLVSLVSILMCDYAISDEYTDSYLNFDCNFFCWGGEHITYSSLACFQIVIYIPIAILYRTLWQEQDRSINIHASTYYLILKNFCVVFLVILSKILKDDHKMIFEILFVVVNFSLFLIVLYIKNCFNFDRANLWCKVMHLCVVWNTIVCILSNHVIEDNYASLVLQLLGLFAIVIGGVYFQHRLPSSLLISKKGRSIVELFRFLFGLQAFANSIYIDAKEDDELNLCEEGSFSK